MVITDEQRQEMLEAAKPLINGLTTIAIRTVEQLWTN